MQEDHDVVSVNVKLKGVVGKDVVVAQATLDALQLEGGMHREQAVPVELEGDGRQCSGASGRPGGDGQALGQSDRLLDLAVRQGAHVIRAEVAQVDDPGQREEETYPDDAAQAIPARVPRLHPRRRGPPVAYIPLPQPPGRRPALVPLRRDEHLELANSSVYLRVDTRSSAHNRHPCLAPLASHAASPALNGGRRRTAAHHHRRRRPHADTIQP